MQKSWLTCSDSDICTQIILPDLVHSKCTSSFISTIYIHLNPYRLPLLVMVATNAVKVAVSLHAVCNEVTELVELAARARTVLALWNRTRGSVGDNSDKFRAFFGAGAYVACHLLYSDMSKEGNESGHLPGTSEVDGMGGHVLCSGRGGVEETESCGEEGGNFAMGEAQEEPLPVIGVILHVLRDNGVVGIVEFGEHGGCNVEPWEAEVRAERVAVSNHVLIFQVPRVLVRHPFRIREYTADLAGFVRDGRFVSTKLLETDDVVRHEIERSVRVEPR